MSRLTHSVTVVALLTAAVLSWQYLVEEKIWSPALIASPTQIAEAVPSLFRKSENLADTKATIFRTITAFSLSIPVGLALGFISGLGKSYSTETWIAVDLLRSIPATALVPLFMVLFAPGDQLAIAAGVFSGSLSIALATGLALRAMNRDRRTVVSLLDVNWYEKLRLYYLPEAAGGIFIGLRSAMSLCLIVIVVAEMIGGGKHGLGRIIFDGQWGDRHGILYGTILVTGLIGWCLNQILVFAESILIHWNEIE